MILVFWSSSYLPGEISCYNKINELFNEYKVFYICIDHYKNKNLWALRCESSKLEGLHYFNPITNNCKSLNDIIRHSDFCEINSSFPIEDYILINKDKKSTYRYNSFHSLFENYKTVQD